MGIAKIFFKVSDVVNYPIRNYVRYPDVTRVKNVRYGEGKYGLMDIFFASEKKGSGGKYPVLFNIHGGGFVAGNKSCRAGIASLFAREGWAVININYTLAPEGFYPIAMRDVMDALNVAYDLREQYELDFDRLVITGDSAGGYYAAELVAMLFDSSLRAGAGVSEYKGPAPKGLLTFCAPFDPVKCLSSKSFGAVTADVAESLFGKMLPDGKREHERGEISVLNSVNPDWCECFMVEAKRDDFCGGQLADMRAALDKHGVRYGYYVADCKGDGHCTHLYPFLKGTKYVIKAALGFLQQIKGDK